MQLLCCFRCQRPYYVEHTRSHLNSVVKRHKARSVLGWGTAWEALRVLLAFCASRNALGVIFDPNMMSLWALLDFCSTSKKGVGWGRAKKAPTQITELIGARPVRIRAPLFLPPTIFLAPQKKRLGVMSPFPATEVTACHSSEFSYH